ncbi:MAG TPA: glycosyltransferase [Polyangiales bacterium]|nr:glycosyltransferase [Polyangiales bacterium]
MADPNTIIVVPCYNEAQRLSVDSFREFATANAGVRFLFVNDGSTDDTSIVLESLASSEPHRFEHLDQGQNRGKAETVRVGMLHALQQGPRYAGYWDADLATPLREITRFIATLEAHPQRDVCFGSRVRLLGRAIERNPLRHYLGRMFATVASVVLDLPVYDTQCGAKLFRATHATEELFEDRFCVNWTFDVELIARVQALRLRAGLTSAADSIYELPLDEWHDVAGSKVQASDFFKGLFEILRIHAKYGRGGRKAARAGTRS